MINHGFIGKRGHTFLGKRKENIVFIFTYDNTTQIHNHHMYIQRVKKMI